MKLLLIPAFSVIVLAGCKSDVEKCVDSMVATNTEFHERTGQKKSKNEIEAEARVMCLRAAAGK
jgi:hypothetical protein